jgi:hypothetical protein
MMMNDYDNLRFERWTQMVRKATKKEMAQVRLRRGQAVQPAPPSLQTTLSFWWAMVRQLALGGIPVMELHLVHWFAPHPQSAQQ